jgi:uncharacterized protein
LITSHPITQRADRDGVDSMVVERDYVLAHIVAQLHRAAPTDGGRIVFKGGTAMRLVHVGVYRYSADLDFTIIGGSKAAAQTALSEVVAAAKEYAGFPRLELTQEPKVAYIGPRGSATARKIKVDLATDEHVESYEQLGIQPVWDDLPESIPFDVYTLEEIAAEKLRCVVQRLESRDLFDLHYLTEVLDVDLSDVRPLFERKAEAKGINPSLFQERFEARLSQYSRRWIGEMSDLLPDDPPDFDGLVREVRRHLRAARLLAKA